MKQPTKRDQSALWQKVNGSSVNTLLTDLKVALTFIGIAETDRDAGKVARNVKNARRAFDSMSLLRARFNLSADQSKELDEGLVDLRRRLGLLGQVF